MSRVCRCTGASVQFSTAEGDLPTWPTAKCGDAHLSPRVTEHQMGQSPRALSSQLQATDMGDSTQMDMTRTQTHNAGPDPSAMFEPGLSSSIVRPTLIATKKVCLESRCISLFQSLNSFIDINIRGKKGKINIRYYYEIFKGLISCMQLFFLMLVSKLKDIKYHQFHTYAL